MATRRYGRRGGQAAAAAAGCATEDAQQSPESSAVDPSQPRVTTPTFDALFRQESSAEALLLQQQYLQRLQPGPAARRVHASTLCADGGWGGDAQPRARSVWRGLIEVGVGARVSADVVDDTVRLATPGAKRGRAGHPDDDDDGENCDDGSDESAPAMAPSAQPAVPPNAADGSAPKVKAKA
jgi:hypothetical protein